MTKKRGKAYVGTSGWTYSDWRGRFYPEQVPRRQWLEYYTSQFASAEINGSFYRTPSLEAVRAWREQTPAGFRFSWKASKFITHWKRLGPTAASSLELLETRLAVLGRKCGPVLFQLPPMLARDDALLADFMQCCIPGGVTHSNSVTRAGMPIRPPFTATCGGMYFRPP